MQVRSTIVATTAALAAGFAATAGPAGAQDTAKFTPAGFTVKTTTKTVGGTTTLRGTGVLTPSDTRQGDDFLFFPPGVTDPAYAVAVGALRACSGKVRVTATRRVRQGGRVVTRRVLRRTVALRPDCTFRTTIRLRRRGTTTLGQIRWVYLGNRSLRGLAARPTSIRTRTR
jgi:hypothetical protein